MIFVWDDNKHLFCIINYVLYISRGGFCSDYLLQGFKYSLLSSCSNSNVLIQGWTKATRDNIHILITGSSVSTCTFSYTVNKSISFIIASKSMLIHLMVLMVTCEGFWRRRGNVLLRRLKIPENNGELWVIESVYCQWGYFCWSVSVLAVRLLLLISLY